MVLKQDECNVAIGKALEKEHAIDKFEIYILITRILQGEIKRNHYQKDHPRYCLHEWKKKTRPVGSKATAATARAMTGIDKFVYLLWQCNYCDKSSASGVHDE